MSTPSIELPLFVFTAGTGVSALAVTQTTDANVWNYGVAVGVIIVLLVPIVRWMMARQDAMYAAADQAAARRETREDKRAELAAQQVLAMQAMVTELQRLTVLHENSDDAHRVAVAEMKGVVKEIPEQVVRNLRDHGFVPRAGPQT